MRILVTYASKRGGTQGIAEWIRDAMVERGVDAVALPAATVRSVGDYDSVIVGGALYAGRWHRSARRFLKHNVRQLRQKPVWLFSSGPLGDSANEHEPPPVAQVTALMESVAARGHVTFGGRLSPDAKGFPASAMAKRLAGDWRDPARTRRWASEIVDILERSTPASAE